MAMLTREQILARKKGERTVELPDGSEVRIRALTRDEVLQADKMAEEDDHAGRDDYIIATALVEPALTIEDVKAWGATAPAGDLVTITEAIAEESGLKQGAPKSGVPAARRKRRR